MYINCNNLYYLFLILLIYRMWIFKCQILNILKIFLVVNYKHFYLKISLRYSNYMFDLFMCKFKSINFWLAVPYYLLDCPLFLPFHNIISVFTSMPRFCRNNWSTCIFMLCMNFPLFFFLFQECLKTMDNQLSYNISIISNVYSHLD